MMFIVHHLDERLVQYMVTEETLDVQHVFRSYVWFSSIKFTVSKLILSQMCYKNILK